VTAFYFTFSVYFRVHLLTNRMLMKQNKTLYTQSTEECNV